MARAGSQPRPRDRFSTQPRRPVIPIRFFGIRPGGVEWRKRSANRSKTGRFSATNPVGRSLAMKSGLAKLAAQADGQRNGIH